MGLPFSLNLVDELNRELETIVSLDETVDSGKRCAWGDPHAPKSHRHDMSASDLRKTRKLVLTNSSQSKDTVTAPLCCARGSRKGARRRQLRRQTPQTYRRQTPQMYRRQTTTTRDASMPKRALNRSIERTRRAFQRSIRRCDLLLFGSRLEIFEPSQVVMYFRQKNMHANEAENRSVLTASIVHRLKRSI